MMMMMIKLKKSLKKKIDFDVTPIFPPKMEKKKIKIEKVLLFVELNLSNIFVNYETLFIFGSWNF